ncbi:hypothetical protein QTP88_004000 [Uroleucon formosanum]
MSGQNNGLNVKVKELYPCAFFVHCYSHKLNLTLQQSASNIKECRIFFQTMSGLAAFFSKSSKRTNVLQNFVKRKLPSVAPTRWNFTSRLVNTIKENYDMLLLFFEHIHDNSDDWDSDSILKAQGFLFFLKKFLSKFLLNIFSTIFSFTDVLFDILQTKAMDIAYCIKKVNEIIIKLQEVRENDFEKIFNDLNTDDGNSCEPPARKRIRKNQVIDDNLNYRRLFSEILDNILNQIKSRFESMGKLEFFSLLNSELYEKYNKVFPDNELKCLDEQYGRFFDILRLKNELHVLYSSEDFKNKPIFEIIKFMNLNKLDLGLKEVYKLATLIATIPSTTASAERSFSALKRIKTYCRSTQGQDRLSSLAILSIEKKILDDLKMNPEFYDNISNFRQQIIEELVKSQDFNFVSPSSRKHKLIETDEKSGQGNKKKRRRCVKCYEKLVSEKGRAVAQKNCKTTTLYCNSCEKNPAFCLECFQASHNSEPHNKELLLAAKEATYAYHTVNHNLSFNSNICNSQLISTFFEPKFTLGKTKCEAIVLNILAPLALDELYDDLNKCNFITVSMDASNRKDIKIVPVIIRYFQPEFGIKVKFLEFKNTTWIKKLSDFVETTVTQTGGVKRGGNNNVFARMKNELGREINGIGCGAHIVHNCMQTAVDVLPIEIKALIVKIYKYLHIYTVRVTKLQEFCEFAEVEYKKVLQHGSTRFLSLLPAIERILLIFEGLKAYFCSQDLCPNLIKNFFTDKRGEIYLWFIHGQLSLFNNSIQAMEKNNASATDVVNILRKLQNIIERKDAKFVSLGAKKVLNTLTDEETNILKIEEDFKLFYERSSEIINLRLKSEIVNQYQLFDEVILAKEFWLLKVKDWKEEEIKTKIKITSEEKWVQLFCHFKEKDILAPNIKLILQYIFCMPGTSAPVERISSLMNIAWSDERARMNENTVRGLMVCKMNFGLTCNEFYEKE